METSETPQQPERKRDFEPWGHVTEPTKHNPATFRYLIHALNPMATTSMEMIAAVVARDEPKAIDREEGDQSINLFSQPEKLDQRVALSCSLVDQEHHGTWGRAGLIVEAPQENVIITDSSDVGAIVMSKKNLLKQARKRHSLTAEQLLQQTHPTSYNEIVVIANEAGRKVALAGFFYKVTEDGQPMDEALYRKMQMHAHRLNLPLVPIIEPNPYSENKITHTEDRFSVQLRGKLYTLQGSPEWKFKAYGQSGFSVFASPDEMQQVIDYLRANNIDEQEIVKIQQEYKEADRLRQQPKVTYDEQGEVTLIEKRTGYGTGEMETTVSKGGYARRVNVIEEARKFSERMADPSRPMMIEPYERVLASPQEAEQVVQEALENAPENERERIMEWWHTARENVIKQWEHNQQKRDFFFSTKFLDLSSFPTLEEPKSYGKPFDVSSILKYLGKKDKREDKE